MAIITDLTYRKEAEATRAPLLERLISAEDDERRRIARELHDETGQSLTALLVGLRTIADIAVLPEVQRVALRLRDVAAHTVDDVGRLARGLHPAVLDDQGLAAAARRYAGDYVRSFGTDVDFVAGDLDSPRLPPLAAATMYRILQETLTNVARHAGAKKVVVELKRDKSALELLVRDDGVGFVVSRARDAASGLGLHGMRERVTLLGGSIDIESTPGQGTEVRARIPAGGTAPSRKNKRGTRRERVRQRSKP
jgi:signal transduction histidine kinase